MIQESLQHIHTWVCARGEGTMGELVTGVPLDLGDIEKLTNQSISPEEVCPHGMVRCSLCGQQYGDQQVSSPSEIPTLRAKIRPYSPLVIKEE